MPPPKKGPVGVAAKLAKIQAAAGKVDKTGKVNFGKTAYSHFQEHGVLGVVKPLLRDYNCALLADVTGWSQEGNHTFIEFQLTLIDSDVPAGEPDRELTARFPNGATDSQDKGFSKAYTYAMKYALQKMFLVPTEDLPDVDNNDPVESTVTRKSKKDTNITAVRAAKVSALAAGAVAAVPSLDANKVKAKLQADYGVDTVAQLSTKKADAFEEWLSGQALHAIG